MKEQIDANFKSHKVSEEKAADMNGIREMCKTIAFTINESCPNSREKALSMTKLEEVMFWANAAIARNQ